MIRCCLPALLAGLALVGCKSETETKKSSETSTKSSPAASAEAAPEKGPSASSEKVSIAPKLRQGMGWSYEQVSEQRSLQTLGGQEIETRQEMALDFDQLLTRVDPGGEASLEVTFRRVRQKQSSPRGSSEFDSANPDSSSSPAAQGVAAMVGAKLTIELGAKHQVLRVKGMDTILEKQLVGVAPEQREALSAQLKGQFGDNGGREMMRPFLAFYPDRTVGVGDSWSREDTLVKPYPMRTNNNYRVISVDSKRIRLQVSGTLRTISGSAPMALGDVQMQLDLRGNTDGSIEVDRESGWLASSSTTQHLEGSLTLSGVPERPPQQVPMRSQVITRIRRKP